MTGATDPAGATEAAGTADDHAAALEAQRRMWSMGDYRVVAERLLAASLDLLDTVGVGVGDHVLDVGVGDGNTAIEAARRGATVVGVDLTPRQLELARARVGSAGVVVDLREGNAEALPFPDESFDAVLSVFGMIFAPDHRRAAAELARVCRPGGVVAITAWQTSEGWHTAWRRRATELVPPGPSGGPDPDAWGDPGEADRRLRAVGLDVRVETRQIVWEFPSSDGAVDFFLRNAGPFLAFQQAAEAAGNGDRVAGALRDAIEESNEATDGTCRMTVPYLLAVGVRP